MTEPIDSLTNNRASNSNKSNCLINLLVRPIQRDEHVDEEFGLFNDDEDNLTLLDLQPKPEHDHNLTVFDELAQQCDAVLHLANLSTTIDLSFAIKPSRSTFSTTNTMINDYERRFQRSLRKLTIPSWYTESSSSPKLSDKPSTTSITHPTRDTHRTLEIVHVRRPQSYRSCHSSLTTSPSPSAHSWHPNQISDGLNFSHLLPSSSVSTGRRPHKYEKGIDRVAKSSRWYQPAQLVATTINKQISASKAVRTNPLPGNSCTAGNYDVPKHQHDNDGSLLISERYYSNSNQRSDCFTDGIHVNDVKNTIINKQNNKKKKKKQQQPPPQQHKSDSSMTNDKWLDNQKMKFNESPPPMPEANEKMPFDRVELEEITDDDDDDEANDKRSPTNNIHIPSIVEQTNNEQTNVLLERLATDLVDSILAEIRLAQDLPDDTNTGVRELSDDENGLRELDENDMNGTDEFIVFATKAEEFDENEEIVDVNDENNEYEPISTVARGSLNRLYTFSRTNDDTALNPRKTPSDQDFSTSELITTDKDSLISNSLLNTDTDQPMISLAISEHTDSSTSPPPPLIYRSHIQKRNINLGRYYDGMMRATNSQLPTHDLRCNLALTNTNVLNNGSPSSDGVTEETVRKARMLLDSIPNPIDPKHSPDDENVSPLSTTPVRSILKNTRFVLTDETNRENIADQQRRIEVAEKQERASPRKIITTMITEEYRRVQRRIIEEFEEDDGAEALCQDSSYSSDPERLHPHQQSSAPAASLQDPSPYESLSDCYSGYSSIRSDFLSTIKTPLVSNVSSLPSTTDEAYGSDPTLASTVASPNMSVSTAGVTTYVHPDLEHEFEYPSPPPPVPDRRLKPLHLRPVPPPPVKPRTLRPSTKELNDRIDVPKGTTSSLTIIQHLTASASNDSTTSTARMMSSRHYCGSLPINTESTLPTDVSHTAVTTNNEKEKPNSKTSHSLNSRAHDDPQDKQDIIFSKPSLNNTKSKKRSTTYFNEATNGLAIRLPAAVLNGSDSVERSDHIRTSTADRRADGTPKSGMLPDSTNPDRSSVYETSV